MSRCSMRVDREISKRTTTSYVLLGLLSIRDWSTYELAQQVQRTVRWFWPRAERRIYDEPKVLVALGLAESRREFTGQRPRTVYAITPEGRQSLSGWLSQPSSPPATEFEAMAKVFFADAGTIEQLRGVIDSIAAAAADRIRWLTAETERTNAGDTRFPGRRHVNSLAVRLHLEQEASVLRWAQWAKMQVVDWKSTSDSGSWDSAEALEDLLRDLHSLLDTVQTKGSAG